MFASDYPHIFSGDEIVIPRIDHVNVYERKAGEAGLVDSNFRPGPYLQMFTKPTTVSYFVC